MRLRALIPLIACVTCTVAARRACAFDHTLQLGGDLFYAQQFVDETIRPPGAGVGARLRYGFNDVLALAFDASWAGHGAVARDDSTVLRQFATVAGGIHYAADVSRIVPFLGLLVGVSFQIDAGEATPAFLVDLGGGLDWSIVPDFSLGLSLSYQLTVADGLLPGRLCVGIRLNWERRFARRDGETAGN
jgi:hypothetical protein